MPLWWDAGTLADIAAWNAQRQGQDADDLFVCSMLANRRGRPLPGTPSGCDSNGPAAGHSHVGITSLYLHVAVEDDAAIGNLFQFAPSRP